MRIHQEKEAEFSCNLCQKHFLYLDYLKNHIESVHFENTYDYKCNICDNIFTKKYHLESHQTTVHAGNTRIKEKSIKKGMKTL